MPSINRQYIDDHNLVARYLANQLPDTERAAFEAYFLEHPEVLAELNRVAQLTAAVAGKPAANRVPWFATAAAALLALTVVTGIWLNRDNSQAVVAASVDGLTSRFAATLPLAQSIRIERTRSSSYDAEFTLPANAAAVELRVKPEKVAVPARYRVAFVPVTDNKSTPPPLVVLSALEPAQDGLVSVYLNTAKLQPAVYELRISVDDDAATDPPSLFLIEVLAAQ
jgi:hypothetical protein